MKRYYFDTNAISFLVASRDGADYVLDHVKRSERAGHVEMIGSTELIEEFVLSAPTHPDEYKAAITALWDVCGPRILRAWNDLMELEIRKRARLSLEEAYLGHETVCKLRDFSMDPARAATCADEIRSRKSEYATRMQEAATEFQQFVESQTEDESEDAESRQREARRQANIAIDRQGIIDWGTDAVIRPDPARFGLSQSESTWPDISTLPCCRAYGGIAMALVRKAHANNRKHTEADDYDTMHYVLSAMADAFVTADVSLRSTIGLIEWGRVPALSPEQLCETINGH